MKHIGPQFSHAVHAVPPMRASFNHHAPPPAFNFGHRILKDLFRLVQGGLSGVNSGRLKFLANDLRDRNSRFMPHLRNG